MRHLRNGTINQWITEAFLRDDDTNTYTADHYIFKCDMEYKGCSDLLEQSCHASVRFPSWLVMDPSPFKPNTPGGFTCRYSPPSPQLSEMRPVVVIDIGATSIRYLVPHPFSSVPVVAPYQHHRCILRWIFM